MLDSPHSGTLYSHDFKHAISRSALRDAEDTLVDDLYDFAPALGIALLAAQFPRSYVDVNRSRFDIDRKLLTAAWPGKALPSRKSELGKGVVWRCLDNGAPIYQAPLTCEEVEDRLQMCWDPYHASLREVLDGTARKYGKVFHLNCHSMPSNPGEFALESPLTAALPDFVLGDQDGRTANAEITRFLQTQIEARGYSCGVNSPYKGVELIGAYSDPKCNRHSIQIEINRKLYLHESSRERSSNYARLKTDLAQILSAFKASFAEYEI